MTDSAEIPTPPEWMKDFDFADQIDLPDRWATCMVLQDLDYDYQLIAIRQLFARNRKAEESLSEEINELDEFARKTTGMRNQHAVEEWVDRCKHSVFQDAASSMSAVGMLAPFIESVFHQAFHSLQVHLAKSTNGLPAHHRWSQSSNDEWDCHFVWQNGNRRKDLVSGIIQLSEAIELQSYLPSDSKLILEALFGYRNKMFHCGFEWPLEERQKFAKRIENSSWPDEWFGKATSGGEPWMHYLSDEFIERCLAFIDEVLEGIGQYCNEKLLGKPKTTNTSAIQ